MFFISWTIAGLIQVDGFFNADDATTFRTTLINDGAEIVGEWVA